MEGGFGELSLAWERFPDLPRDFQGPGVRIIGAVRGPIMSPASAIPLTIVRIPFSKATTTTRPWEGLAGRVRIHA